MIPRYIVTVDRDGIDKGSTTPIRIEGRDGHVQAVSEAVLLGHVRIVYGPPRQDGARVWIEADRVAIST